jgi:hypothetical protein
VFLIHNKNTLTTQMNYIIGELYLHDEMDIELSRFGLVFRRFEHLDLFARLCLLGFRIGLKRLPTFNSVLPRFLQLNLLVIQITTRANLIIPRNFSAILFAL